MLEAIRAHVPQSREAAFASNVTDRVHTVFTERLNLVVPSVDTDLLENGILDSLALVNLLVHIEQEFSIVISLDDLEIEHFRSIRAISCFLLPAL